MFYFNEQSIIIANNWKLRPYKNFRKNIDFLIGISAWGANHCIVYLMLCVQATRLPLSCWIPAKRVIQISYIYASTSRLIISTNILYLRPVAHARAVALPPPPPKQKEKQGRRNGVVSSRDRRTPATADGGETPTGAVVMCAWTASAAALVTHT